MYEGVCLCVYLPSCIIQGLSYSGVCLCIYICPTFLSVDVNSLPLSLFPLIHSKYTHPSAIVFSAITYISKLSRNSRAESDLKRLVCNLLVRD